MDKCNLIRPLLLAILPSASLKHLSYGVISFTPSISNYKFVYSSMYLDITLCLSIYMKKKRYVSRKDKMTYNLELERRKYLFFQCVQICALICFKLCKCVDDATYIASVLICLLVIIYSIEKQICMQSFPLT